MSNLVPVSNVVSTNGLVAVDLDALQQMINALFTYADTIDMLIRQLEQERNNLPTYWQGSNAAHQASEELLNMILLLQDNLSNAYAMAHGLHEALQFYQQAGNTGR